MNQIKKRTRAEKKPYFYFPADADTRRDYRFYNFISRAEGQDSELFMQSFKSLFKFSYTPIVMTKVKVNKLLRRGNCIIYEVVNGVLRKVTL